MIPMKKKNNSGNSVSEVENVPKSAPEQAKLILNKSVLIGLTYKDSLGNIFEQKQVHGKIIKATPRRISIRLEGSRAGDIFNLPPDLESFEKAPPGTYTLHSTGEKIVNPDYLTTWEINSPPPE
jgi:hypothetical protein